jgi:hypothetical protein
MLNPSSFGRFDDMAPEGEAEAELGFADGGGGGRRRQRREPLGLDRSPTRRSWVDAGQAQDWGGGQGDGPG